MDTILSNAFETIFLISVVLLNYFFLSMWKILYGSWFHLRPTWKWPKDLKRLKLLASHADSDEVRQKCKFILNGLYLSGGVFLLGILIGII